jgi:hypothetical protein
MLFLILELLLLTIVGIYALLGYQCYLNYNVLFSVLLTKIVDTAANKQDNLKDYAIWLGVALGSGIFVSGISIAFAILLFASNDRQVYLTSTGLFFVLAVALLVIGIYANKTVADDIVTFDFPIPYAENKVYNITFNIDTQKQSSTFRYGPVISTYVSSAICLLIALISYADSP